MAKIEWNDNLSVGIDQIDEEHKMLIQHLNDLASHIEINQGETEIAKTIEFLIDYTDFHFTSEEKLMAESSYPGLAYQKEQHEEFKAALKRIIEDYEEEGPTKELVASINTLLVNWLIKHIEEVDLKLGDFLNKNA